MNSVVTGHKINVEKFVAILYTNNELPERKINIREMETHIMRYHLTSVRMPVIQKTTNNKCWQDYEEREHSYTVGGIENQCSHYGKQYGYSSKK